MNWYLECWKKYVDFSGRARRTEYWMFVLFNALAAFAIAIVDNLLGLCGALGGLYCFPGLRCSSAVCMIPTAAVGWCSSR